MKLREAGGALRERPFRFQFLASATSVLGDNIVPVALAFAVLDLSGSASDLGVVLGARTLAMVVLLPIAGVWGDRLPRQKLITLANIICGLTQGALGVLVVSGAAELWHFVALEAVNGAATALLRPAQVGLTPKTVSRRRLQQANALLSLTYSGASIVGPALGGLIVATLGPGWALIVDAATFLISALFLVQIHLSPSAQRIQRLTFLRDFSAGWKEVRTRRWLFIGILSFMLFQLLALPAMFVLGPFVAERSLGGAATWSAILAAGGVGALVGDAVAIKTEPQRPLTVAFLGGVLAAPVLVLLGIHAPTWALAASALLWGACISFGNTLWFTALQEHVPDQTLSRVSSFDWFGSTALRPVGFALVGPVANKFGIDQTLIGAGIIIAATQVTTALLPSVSQVRRVRIASTRASQLPPESTSPQ